MCSEQINNAAAYTSSQRQVAKDRVTDKEMKEGGGQVGMKRLFRS